MATVKVWNEAEVWNALADALEDTGDLPAGLHYPTTDEDTL